MPFEERLEWARTGRTGDGRNEKHHGDEHHGEPVDGRHASSPLSVPVLDENRSVSTPIRWSMVTNRFASGSFRFSSNAR